MAKDVVWLVNRLRSMSPAEVAWRVREQALRRTAKGRLDRWDCYDPAGDHAPQLPGIRAALAKASPQVRQVTQNAAERVLAGEFSALGASWPRNEVRPDFPADMWTLDPVTGRHWPGAERFCFDIGYRHAGGYGDIKYAWEYNRLQFLQPVAAHYLFSGDKAALAFLEAAVKSWFENNPPYRGIGWNSGIELALRAISLLFVSSCCGNDLSVEMRRRIRSILVSHLRWMQRFPSRFSSANNHLIAECAGEFLIGLAMPELPDAAAVVAKAKAVLEDEAGKQILSDGVGAEQSPTYGAFTAEFLLLCAQAGKAAGRPLDRRVDAALSRFAGFIEWIALGNGRVPPIGDDDEGRVITLACEERCYAASVASAIRAFLGEKLSGTLPDERSLREVVFGRPPTAVEPPSGIRVFKSGGLSVFRGHLAEKPAMVVFDHGPLGYLSIAAHGHADALSWQLYLEDRAILVDPGTYLYHSGGAWRDWFRSTAAHNTLRLGERDQSIMSGAFNWSRKANAALLDHEEQPVPSFRASHDGYEKEFGLVHERTLSILPSSVRVTDRLIGDRPPPKAELSYQLCPDALARIEGDCVAVSINGRPALKITFPLGGTITVFTGEEPGMGGWVSDRFGLKTPAPRIVWTTMDFPAEAVSLFEIL